MQANYFTGLIRGAAVEKAQAVTPDVLDKFKIPVYNIHKYNDKEAAYLRLLYRYMNIGFCPDKKSSNP